MEAMDTTPINQNQNQNQVPNPNPNSNPIQNSKQNASPFKPKQIESYITFESYNFSNDQIFQDGLSSILATNPKTTPEIIEAAKLYYYSQTIDLEFDAVGYRGWKAGVGSEAYLQDGDREGHGSRDVAWDSEANGKDNGKGKGKGKGKASDDEIERALRTEDLYRDDLETEALYAMTLNPIHESTMFPSATATPASSSSQSPFPVPVPSLSKKHTQTQISEDVDGGRNGSEGEQVILEEEGDGKGEEMAYPATFAELVDLIKSGKPIPGIKTIPDKLNGEQPSLPVRSVHLKPWESKTFTPSIFDNGVKDRGLV